MPKLKSSSLTFEWTKVNQKCQNGQFWRVFENLKLAFKQCYQTGQKFVKSAKIQKFKDDIMIDF